MNVLARIGLLCIIAAFSACTDKNLEKELDDWCSCIHENQDGLAAPECQDIMNKMSVKYEYDPGAVDIIQKRAEECR